MTLIGTVGTAFRAPNIIEQFFEGPTPEGSGYQSRNTDIKPERSFNVDLGARYRDSRFYFEGFVTQTWRDVREVDCSIEPLRQEERVEASRVEGRRSHRLRMRHHPDLTDRHRLKFGSRVFNIDELLNPLEADRELHALVVETT